MTLDEAIKTEEHIAEENQRVVDTGIVFDDVTIDVLYCDDTEVIEEHLANYQRHADEHRQLAGWLKELKQLKEQTKWIPVSERLPEEKQAVLVWCPQYKNIYCAYLEKEQWWIFGAFVQIVPNEVIAWMPLPEPYNGESEDKK